MTYWEFLVMFLGIPLLLTIGLLRGRIGRDAAVLLAAVSLVALVYTAPWDNLIVVNGVWSYARRQILGAVIGHVPLEEYVFYVLQVFLTGLLTVALLRRDEARR